MILSNIITCAIQWSLWAHFKPVSNQELDHQSLKKDGFVTIQSGVNIECWQWYSYNDVDCFVLFLDIANYKLHPWSHISRSMVFIVFLPLNYYSIIVAWSAVNTVNSDHVTRDLLQNVHLLMKWTLLDKIRLLLKYFQVWIQVVDCRMAVIN